MNFDTEPTAPLAELERSVERARTLLDRLPTDKPPVEVLRRTRLAVRREVERLGRRRRMLRLTRAVVGLAAAIVMALTLRLSANSQPLTNLQDDPSFSLESWSAALDQSTQRLCRLAGRESELAPAYDDSGDVEELLDTLGTSLRMGS